MPVVTIQIEDDEVIPTRVPGIVVEFYNTSGAFQTSGTTDSIGEVTVTLAAADYDILMFKVGVTILPRQPQRIHVLTQVPPNVFLVSCHVRVMPESIDASKCRVSGYIINAQGMPQKGVKITIGPIPELISVGGRLVDPDHQILITSDKNGYVEFDLLRKIVYEAYILYKDEWQGQPPGRLSIRAPDAPAVLLDYLLFPLPAHVEFSATTLSVAHGAQDDTTTLTVTYTDGNTRQLPLQWGTYRLVISDPAIFEIEVAGDTLIVKGLVAGVATLTAEKIFPNTSVWLPEPPFVADILTVTVT